MSAKDDLIDDLLSAFTESEDDSAMCVNIANAIKTYAEKGNVIVTVAGQISAGTFTGGGSSHLSLTATLMSAPLILVCEAMKVAVGDAGNILYAQGIGADLDLMSNALNTLEINVTGTTVNPSGTVVPPSSGTIKGKIAGKSAPLVTKLLDVFDYMNDPEEEDFDGNQYFAEELADLLETYYTTATVSVSGTGGISGASGSGSISFS